MFDFSNLIGLTETQAKKTLKDNGFEKIKTIVNAEHKEICDSLVVCKAHLENDEVVLVCGEFYLQIKGI